MAHERVEILFFILRGKSGTWATRPLFVHYRNWIVLELYKAWRVKVRRNSGSCKRIGFRYNAISVNSGKKSN